MVDLANVALGFSRQANVPPVKDQPVMRPRNVLLRDVLYELFLGIERIPGIGS